MKFFVSGTIEPECVYVFFCAGNKKTEKLIPKDEFGNPIKTNEVSTECFLKKCCSLKMKQYSLADIKQL